MTLIAGCFQSCKDMDETYKEFLVPNGLKYPQQPDSLKIQAGYNKVRLTWHKAKDPSVVRAEVYWNNYQDTLEVNSISLDQDIVTVDILNLDENSYTFYVRTFDADGNASVPVEITGTPYGEFYITKTTNRTISNALLNSDGSGTIIWAIKTTDLIYSEVRYRTNSGELNIVRVLPDESMLNCPDVKAGELFEYRSVFMLPQGIDGIAKEWVTFELPFLYKFPRNEWTGESTSNHSWGANGGPPQYLFDGDINTGWHSNTSASLPQCVVVDMKQSVHIHHLVMAPFPVARYRYTKTVEIYLRDTYIAPAVPQPEWGEPTISVEYNGEDVFTIYFPSIPKGRYMAIVFPDSQTGNNLASLMEVEVFGYLGS
jgi:hypothetical protein